MMADSRDDGLSVVKARSLPESSTQTETMMPLADFVPGDWDVICQRGKESFEHVGNQRFRKCIDDHILMYMKATTRQEKSSIVTRIYEEVRGKATKPSGGFVKKDLLTRCWYQVSEKEARDKVGQALRDAIKIIRASTSGKKVDGLSKPATTKRARMSSGALKNASKHAELQNAPTRKSPPLFLTDFGSALEVNYASAGSLAARSHLENQMTALGTFPLANGALTKWEGFEGSPMKTMLESAIEPIDNYPGEQSIDSQSLNRKRRRPMEQDVSSLVPAWSLGERQELNASLYLEEQAFSKRIRQLTPSNSNPTSAASRQSESLNTLRRHSLLGGQHLFSSQDTPQGWPFHLESAAHPSSSLKSQPSYGLLHKNQIDSRPLSSLFSNPGHSGASDHCHTNSQGAWDLEPTPISTPEQIIDHVRSS